MPRVEKQRMLIDMYTFTKKKAENISRRRPLENGGWVYANVSYQPDVMYRKFVIDRHRGDVEGTVFMLASPKSISSPLIKRHLRMMGVEAFLASGKYGVEIKPSSRVYKGGSKVPVFLLHPFEGSTLILGHVVLP